MYYVYILRDQSDNSLYVGYTPDLRKRFERHVRGYVYSTKKMKSIELVYYEAYKVKEDAIRRERALKLHAKALVQLKGRLRDSLR